MQKQYLSFEVTFPDGAPPPEGLKLCVEGKPDYKVGLICSTPPFQIMEMPATISQMMAAVQEILAAGGVSSLRYTGPQVVQDPSPKIPIKDDEWTFFNVAHVSEVPGYFMKHLVGPRELIKVRLIDGRELVVHATALADESWLKNVTHWVKL